MHRAHVLALVLPFSVLAACSSSSVEERTIEVPVGETSTHLAAVTSFGSNPGNLQMFEYAPAGLPANAPLVVAMHGCTQSATAYENAGWNELADTWGFYVLYPQQQSSNQSSSCFEWWDPSQTSRDQGEALSIKQMVDTMKAKHSVDASRVFVTGLSAGAAMTAVMLATYPDVFAAGAIMAGLPFRCASSLSDTSACQYSGKSETPAQWGALVKNAYPGYTGAYPRVSVWHGDADTTVKPSNATELVKQFASVNGVDSTTPTLSETVDGAAHKTYADGSGTVRVESYIIPKMTHGTAIDPGFAPAGGCGVASPYILSAGICSTYYAGLFFGLGTAAPPTDAGAPTTDAGVVDSGSTSSSSGGTTPPDSGFSLPTWPGWSLPPSTPGKTTCGLVTCIVGNCCTAYGTCGYKFGGVCSPSY